MWLLSGALFPQAGAPAWLRVIMAVNPMTYALAALRRGIYLGSVRADAVGTGVPPLALSLGIATAFAALMFGLASRQARRTTSGDLH